VDHSGHIESFRTESPKGIRLEKMKGVAIAVKKVHFEPAKKDGAPEPVKIRIEFDCSKKSSSGTQ
jgi:hypothetical protein